VVIGGASLAFDNLSSTSKDGKLTAIDFLPVAAPRARSPSPSRSSPPAA